jgi:hypothetical protein
MKLIRNLGGTLTLTLLTGLVLSSVPAVAQSTLTALSVERTLTLSNVLSTITPNIPANVLAAIASGALEVREQTQYNAQQSTLTSTVFVVPVGSPTPTSLSQLPVTSIIAITAISTTNIAITSKPTPAVFISGPISQSSVTPFGNYIGATGSYSFGYTTDTPPKINNVIEVVAGTIVIYSPAGTGTFTITTPGGGSTGGGGTGVAIVVNGSSSATPNFQTTTNQIILDASKSTSSNAGALTYTWTITQGSAGISFPNGNTSIANVQLGSGKITYIITLKVTDATGASTTVPISITLI